MLLAGAALLMAGVRRTPDAGPPIGTIVAFGGTTPPDDWLLCDGAPLDSLAYHELFKIIDTTFGSGLDAMGAKAPGQGFNLPDLRGVFLRGLDVATSNGGPATGRDKDVVDRVAWRRSGRPGAAVGSVEGGATALPQKPFELVAAGGHSHTVTPPLLPNFNKHGSYPTTYGVALDLPARQTSPGAAYSTSALPDHTHRFVPGSGDAETRPVNVAVHYIIRVK